MALTLRIRSYRNQAPEAPLERRFDRLGGTIGRGEGSHLQLPDPDKYISRTHCKVDFVDGRYTLVDLGSNPSSVNDRLLGAGKAAMLADGDRLVIGDYVLEVSVDEPGMPAALPVFEPVFSAAHPFQAQPAVAAPGAQPEYFDPNDSLAEAKILETGPGLAGHDPLGLHLSGSGPAASDPLAFRGSEADHVAPQFVPLVQSPEPEPEPEPLIEAPRSPPLSRMLIPDDYDPLADFVPPPAQQPVAPSPAALPAAAGDREVLQAMLRGLGLPDAQPAGSPAETAELVGAMLREATAGTMDVLLARAMTRRESRLELTVLGAQANNPLKFFPDATSALQQMLTGELPGYMPPLKSFGSAFDDLKSHELAVIAGMRAALAGVLARFDPAAIERSMESQGLVDKLLGASRKARMWDRMVEQYGQVAREAGDDFQRLFGERFSAAYEDQVGRLNDAAHTNNETSQSE